MVIKKGAGWYEWKGGRAEKPKPPKEGEVVDEMKLAKERK